MGVVIGIIFYAIIAYITCPRKENGSFEGGSNSIVYYRSCCGFGDLSYMQ